MTYRRNGYPAALAALGAACVLAAAVLLVSNPAQAGVGFTDLEVNTTEDLEPGTSPPINGVCDQGPGGTCTLREAVLEIAGDPAGGTVTFHPSTDGTPIELLGQVAVVVPESLTITGNGAANTIIESVPFSPPQNFRGFRAGIQTHERHFAFEGGPASVSSLTLRNGFGTSGGSIFFENGATLDVDRVHFEDNGAVHGGAIYAHGEGDTLTVTGSTFVGNEADRGGALYVDDDTAVITNSTFTGNSAFSGAAVFGDVLSTVTIEYTTISDNFALFTENPGLQGFRALPAGLGEEVSGAVAARQLEQAADITISNSILEATDGQSTDECGGAPITSGGGNVVDDESCNFAEPLDEENTAAVAGELGNNGGPTHTMAITADSPAIDVDPGPCGIDDQRGLPRDNDGDADGTAGCDSGAYELQVEPDPEPEPEPEDEDEDADPATPTEAEPSFTG